jgi:betaine lipid synthase
MLGLVAAQLKQKVESKDIKAGKAVWVDVSFGL